MKLKRLIKKLIDFSFKSKGKDLSVKVNGVERPIKFEFYSGKDLSEPYINICITEGRPTKSEISAGLYLNIDKYYPSSFPESYNVPYFWINKETWVDEYKKTIIRTLYETPAYVLVDGYVNDNRQVVTLAFGCVAMFHEYEDTITKLLNNEKFEK